MVFVPGLALACVLSACDAQEEAAVDRDWQTEVAASVRAEREGRASWASTTNTCGDDPSTEIDEAHHSTAHYDRHVRLFRESPNGVFAQFNPRVTCEHYEMGLGTAHAEANQGE